ncbi:hypothetical protein HWV62_10429 [Athelia sp. TMB]|nr:hypothetical protein HWV62_10429 [Athelia sp. TMB]
MYPEWFFQLHYAGQKGARLESGTLSHHSVCKMFLDDLAALRAGQVKADKITQIGSTIGLTHVDDPKSRIQHKRYMKIASQQELDPDFADVMSPSKARIDDRKPLSQKWTSQDPDKIPDRPASMQAVDDQAMGRGSTATTQLATTGPLVARISLEEDVFGPHESQTVANSAEATTAQEASLPGNLIFASRSDKIQWFTEELLKTRKSIHTAQAQELAFAGELEKLDAPVPPATEEPTELVNLKAQLKATQEALEAEKGLHQLSKRRLEEIEEECRSPFVVPALLKAFVQIADLSHAATVTTRNGEAGS